MTVKPVKKEPPPTPRLAIEANGDGAIVRYRWKLYRFMFEGGATLDVIAIRDDSDLRGELLRYTKEERIVGVAEVGEVPAPVAKRTISRRGTPPVSD